MPRVLDVEGAGRGQCDGRYELMQSAEQVNGYPAWRRAGDARFLYSTPDGFWRFAQTTASFASGAGWYITAHPHNGEAPCDVLHWKQGKSSGVDVPVSVRRVDEKAPAEPAARPAARPKLAVAVSESAAMPCVERRASTGSHVGQCPSPMAQTVPVAPANSGETERRRAALEATGDISGIPHLQTFVSPDHHDSSGDEMEKTGEGHKPDEGTGETAKRRAELEAQGDLSAIPHIKTMRAGGGDESDESASPCGSPDAAGGAR